MKFPLLLLYFFISLQSFYTHFLCMYFTNNIERLDSKNIYPSSRLKNCNFFLREQVSTNLWLVRITKISIVGYLLDIYIKNLLQSATLLIFLERVFSGVKNHSEKLFWNFDEATPNVSAHWTLKCLKFCTKGTWNAY